MGHYILCVLFLIRTETGEQTKTQRSQLDRGPTSSRTPMPYLLGPVQLRTAFVGFSIHRVALVTSLVYIYI